MLSAKSRVGTPGNEMETTGIRSAINVKVISIAGSRVPSANECFNSPEANKFIHIHQLWQHIHELFIRQRQRIGNRLQITAVVLSLISFFLELLAQIGRASCRERV